MVVALCVVTVPQTSETYSTMFVRMSSKATCSTQSLPSSLCRVGEMSAFFVKQKSDQIGFPGLFHFTCLAGSDKLSLGARMPRMNFAYLALVHVTRVTLVIKQ